MDDNYHVMPSLEEKPKKEKSRGWLASQQYKNAELVLKQQIKELEEKNTALIASNLIKEDKIKELEKVNEDTKYEFLHYRFAITTSRLIGFPRWLNETWLKVSLWLTENIFNPPGVHLKKFINEARAATKTKRLLTIKAKLVP